MLGGCVYKAEFRVSRLLIKDWTNLQLPSFILFAGFRKFLVLVVLPRESMIDILEVAMSHVCLDDSSGNGGRHLRLGIGGRHACSRRGIHQQMLALRHISCGT